MTLPVAFPSHPPELPELASPPRRSLRGVGLTALAISVSMLTAATTPAWSADPKTGKVGNPIVISQRVIEVAGGISFDSMKKAQKEVLELASQGDEPIWVRINSPGGSVDAGLILIDTMKAVKAPIHCIVESSAYSMGAIILTFCDKRYGMPHATFMLHEASYGTAGEDPHNRSKIDFLTKYLDRMHDEIAKNLKMDPKKYRTRIRDTWWMLADEAKSTGLIEEVITSIAYQEIAMERTEEKKTVTLTRDLESSIDGTPNEPAKIPKRKD